LGASGTLQVPGQTKQIVISTVHWVHLERDVLGVDDRDALISTVHWVHLEPGDESGRVPLADISTVHWVHLERAMPVSRLANSGNFNRSLGVSGTSRTGFLGSLMKISNVHWCIWNPALHLVAADIRVISTVHWVHLERRPRRPSPSGPDNFNRSLGASGTRSERSARRGSPHFNRSLGASGTQQFPA